MPVLGWQQQENRKGPVVGKAREVTFVWPGLVVAFVLRLPSRGLHVTRNRGAGCQRRATGLNFVRPHCYDLDRKSRR